MPRGRPPKYPWPRWLDGERHILRPKENWAVEDGLDDFYPATVKVASIRAEVHAAALRKGGKVDTKLYGDSVSIRYMED